VTRRNGASSAFPDRKVFATKPRPPRISAAPTIFPHHGVGAVSEPARDLDADERHRRRPEQHPQSEARMNRPEHPVPHRPERLEHRAVEDVRADGGLHVEAEEQDQDRRHQRPAAHPRHADEDPDGEPR